MEVQGEGEDTGPNWDNVILGGCAAWLVVAAQRFSGWVGFKGKEKEMSNNTFDMGVQSRRFILSSLQLIPPAEPGSLLPSTAGNYGPDPTHHQAPLRRDFASGLRSRTLYSLEKR